MAVLKFRSMGTAGNHGMGTVRNHGSTHVCRLWSRDERHLFCSSCLCPFFFVKVNVIPVAPWNE